MCLSRDRSVRFASYCLCNDLPRFIDNYYYCVIVALSYLILIGRPAAVCCYRWSLVAPSGVSMADARYPFQIRVVKAFQAGLDRREPSLTGPSAARLREISRQLKLQVEHEGKPGAFPRSVSRQSAKQNETVTSL
uniref:Plasma membrane calcium transporting P-type ATPase C-terminal domain-containing protein n=1 Tax=Plectus sambesii TaxID=2011161 RepID=A0A914V476_9BILA